MACYLIASPELDVFFVTSDDGGATCRRQWYMTHVRGQVSRGGALPELLPVAITPVGFERNFDTMNFIFLGAVGHAPRRVLLPEGG